MTRLAQHLATTGTSQRAFARQVGASASFVNEIVRGLKSPGLSLALRIQEATSGAVSVSDLVLLPDDPSAGTASLATTSGNHTRLFPDGEQ